jgi:hypothetical protein
MRAQDTKQQVGQALGHVAEGLDLVPEGVIALQQTSFCGKILLDRLLNAALEKIRVRDRNEVAIEVAGVVQEPRR